MPGTAVGIFWIDQLLKPVVKHLLNNPVLTLLLVCAIYAFVGYQVLKASYLE